MNTWFLIFLCGFITFIIRFLPLSGIFDFKFSKNNIHLIKIIPIVVLTPIICQAIFFVSNDQIFIINNPKLYAAIIGVIISLLFKNVIFTIVIGMVSFWFINETNFFIKIN